MDASEDMVIGLVVLSAIAAIPLFLVAIALLLAGVALCLSVFFFWGALVNVGTRSLLAMFFEDNGHWWGFLEASDLLFLLLLASGLVFVFPLAVITGTYWVLPREEWLRVLQYTALIGSFGMMGSLVGYFVTNWKYQLPYLSEIALRAEETKIKTKVRLRFFLWKQRIRLTWKAFVGG